MGAFVLQSAIRGRYDWRLVIGAVGGADVLECSQSLWVRGGFFF